MNEALNQSQVRVTPKSKVFHESMSFHYRDANVIGCHNWGYEQCWSEYYSSLGIMCSPSFAAFLQRVEKKRKRYKEHIEKAEVKRRRAHKQDATEKNCYMRTERPSTDLVSVLTSEGHTHGVPENKDKNGPNALVAIALLTCPVIQSSVHITRKTWLQLQQINPVKLSKLRLTCSREFVGEE